MNTNDDFEEQIKQEKLAEEKHKALSQNVRVDDDGTEYEWDEDKQAWFPKIDEDFIARYQLSYGSDAADVSAKVDNPGPGDSTKADDTSTNDSKEAEKYWNDYYNYYYYYYYNHGNESSAAGASPSLLTDSDETYKNYLEYCQSYYNTTESSTQPNSKDDGISEVKDDAKDDKPTEEDQSMNENKKTASKRKIQEPRKWFEVDESSNTNVYVSGLPLDITDEEFAIFMSKCGLVMHDPQTRRPKLKLYRDASGLPKGDGRCCYIKKESVELALQILDGSELRGKLIKVEKAHFQMKGDFDASKCRKKLSNKEKRKLKDKQERLFDWHPEKLPGTRANHEKVIVLKNVFDPSDFEKNPALIADLRMDLRQECDKYGDVKKIVLFDRHEDGVVMVFYKDPDHADVCQTSLNGRWFAKRRLLASTWNGITKYDVAETEEEKKKRLQTWNTFLEDDTKPEDANSSNSTKDLAETITTEASSTSKLNQLDSSADTDSLVQNDSLTNKSS